MPSQAQFPKCLRVMAEYGSSGVWVVESVGPFRHEMIEHRVLGLPGELSSRFVAWIERYLARLADDSFDVDAFNAEGRSLAVALKGVVGEATEVVFEPEREDGGLGASEIIQPA